MNLIQQITADSFQRHNLVLPSGETVLIELYFRPMQFGWFIQSLNYKGFIILSLRITNSPNMLYQFRNQLPFGLACFSTANREPTQQEDFASGASKLYFLTPAEVVEYTEFLQHG